MTKRMLETKRSLHLQRKSTPSARAEVTRREQIFTWKHRSRVKFWQDFGVVGTPATDSAGSIRVYAHSTETRSSASTPVMLRQREQRDGNICSLAWGTSLVLLLLTLQLYLGYSCCAVRTHVPSICLEQHCLAGTNATAILGVLAFSRSQSC